MKLNAETAISTPNVLLVPYSEHHVETYHEWMKDKSLQEATSSLPLSLSEEYAMQRSWRLDHDKLTFIICLPLDPAPEQPLGRRNSQDGSKPENPLSASGDGVDRMIGDVNLFLVEDADESDDQSSDEVHDESENKRKGERGGAAKKLVGELEIMIASHKYRGQGRARAALGAFIAYIARHEEDILAEYDAANYEQDSATRATKTTSIPPSGHCSQLRHLRVKIQQDNTASIRLFEGLEFKRWGGVNYFGEVEMRLPMDTAGKGGGKGGVTGREAAVEVSYQPTRYISSKPIA